MLFQFQFTTDLIDYELNKLQGSLYLSILWITQSVTQTEWHSSLRIVYYLYYLAYIFYFLNNCNFCLTLEFCIILPQLILITDTDQMIFKRWSNCALISSFTVGTFKGNTVLELQQLKSCSHLMAACFITQSINNKRMLMCIPFCLPERHYNNHRNLH